MTGLADRIGTVETRIVRRLVTAILKAGEAIDARDEEADAAVILTDRAAILEKIGHTEQTILDVYRRPTDRNPYGWICLIHGNGTDVISDFTDCERLMVFYETAISGVH